jgi:hypothetical protein
MSEPVTIKTLDLDTVERLALLDAIECAMWQPDCAGYRLKLLRELRDRIRVGLGEVS